MYCYLIEDFNVSVMIRLTFSLPVHRTTQISLMPFSDDTPTFSCFFAFTQDHTDVLLFNRGFYSFSDDTPTFSCSLAFTQDHTDVLLFNRGFSRFSEDTPTFS